MNHSRLLFVFFSIFICLFFCSASVGQYRIQRNGLYGFIDSLGNETIKPQYKYVSNFTESGYALVISSIEDHHDSTIIEGSIFRHDELIINYGYINLKNEYVIPPVIKLKLSYSDLKPYWNVSDPSFLVDAFNNGYLAFNTIIFRYFEPSEGRFVFQDEDSGRFGYKDMNGRLVTAPRYHSCRNFSNGLAVVRDTLPVLPPNVHGNSEMYSFITRGLNTLGAIDIHGNLVIPCKYRILDDFISNKTTISMSSSFDNDGKDIKVWRKINDKDEVLLPPTCNSNVRYWNSDEGLYIYGLRIFNKWFYTYVKENGTYLTDYNHDGDLSITSDNGKPIEVFNDITSFVNGIAGIKTDHWYVINKNLEQKAGPFDSLYEVSEGLMAVKELSHDGKHSTAGYWGYLDTSMKQVIPFSFADCNNFHNGLAYFRKDFDTYRIYGYINKRGKCVWQTTIKRKDI
jgi:hypothetical protein